MLQEELSPIDKERIHDLLFMSINASMGISRIKSDMKPNDYQANALKLMKRLYQQEADMVMDMSTPRALPRLPVWFMLDVLFEDKDRERLSDEESAAALGALAFQLEEAKEVAWRNKERSKDPAQKEAEEELKEREELQDVVYQYHEFENHLRSLIGSPGDKVIGGEFAETAKLFEDE